MNLAWLHRKTLLIALTLLLALGVAFAPFGNVAQAADDKEFTIAFVVKNVVNPFWQLSRLGAEQAAREAGVKLVHAAPTRPDDLNESIQIMEDLITQYQAGSIDAVVLAPVDYQAMVPVVRKANEANVPIINFSDQLAGGEYVTFIGYSDRRIAADAAHYIANELGGKGNVIILEGVPGAVTAQNRLEGFRSALAEYPGIKILASQTANYARAQALQVTENLLQRYPHVDAILAANDEMALGAVRALQGAGLAGRVLVSGVNATDDALDSILAGTMTITVDYDGYAQGYHAVLAAAAYLRGEPVSGDNFLEHTVVHKGNAQKFLDLYQSRVR